MALPSMEDNVSEIYADIASNPRGIDVFVSAADQTAEDWPKIICIPLEQGSEEDEPEVDTQFILKRLPMHSQQEHEHDQQGTAKTNILSGQKNLGLPWESSVPVLKPRLTLSAFRGPAANITQTDPSRRLEQFYDLHRPGSSGVLGHGAFSTVRLAVRREDSFPVAVKVIAKHEALRSRRLRPGRHLEEWEILRKMAGHQAIIQLLDVFETDEEIQLVLEYCEGGELFNAIQRKRNRSHSMRRGQYTEQQAACITNQILRALCDLHAAGIVHRDIKPENIFLTSNDDNSVRVKLGDFGMARALACSADGQSTEGDTSPLTPGATRSFSFIGGSHYAAPEICYGCTYDTSVDMYSLGVTLYIVLCGFPPVFSGPEADQVTFPHTYWKDISEDAKELVRMMLHPNANARIAAQEALRDRWIWKHRSNIARLLSPSALRCRSLVQSKTCDMDAKSVKLDLLRRRLSKSLTTSDNSSTNSACNTMENKRCMSEDLFFSSPKKPRLCNSTSSALMALADLYRDVAQSPSAKVISSVVVVEHHLSLPMENLHHHSTPFNTSPLPTLSV